MAEGRLALVHMNALRIRHQNKLKEEDFEQYLEDQPIVVEDLSAALSASITFATGDGIGTGIGAAIGALGGGIGVAIGAPVGLDTGLIVAGVTGLIYKKTRGEVQKTASKQLSQKTKSDESTL